MKTEISRLGMAIGGIRHISGREFMSIPYDEAILLDVRPDYELSRLFDVPNALYCAYQEIDARYHELPKDIYLVVADAAGLRSKETACKLIEHGFTRVLNLSGGIVEWERDGLPITINRTRILTGSCMCQLRTREKKHK